MTPSLRDQTVVVVGAGRSGLWAARLLARAGAKVAVEDVRSAAEVGSTADELKAHGVELRLGRALTAEALDGCDMVVVSPGVPLALEALEKARARGRRVLGEVELASWFLRPNLPVLGITGTNGKSTTTALCGELLTHGGLRPFVGGNLGRPLSEAALSIESYGAYVVELSSYQLEGLESLVLHAAALTNLAPDHLDRYPNYQAYQSAKARIFRGSGAAVVNLADEAAVRLALGSSRTIYGFSSRLERPVALPVERLVAEAMPDAGGFRVETRLHDTVAPLFRRGEPRHGFSLGSRALRGVHNLENAMAATLLARLSGVSDERIQRGLDAFPGLPHRLELVRTLEGVEWVNDSKATNVDSAVVGLRALSEQSVWLIAGGKGKGAPYTPLVEEGRERLRGVLTIGQDAPAIARAFTGVVDVVPCETLERAVAEARSRARAGEAVLLSPACASFDQFKSFEERGQTFRRLVEAM